MMRRMRETKSEEMRQFCQTGQIGAELTPLLPMAAVRRAAL
jgi:hypothetical protein